MFCRDGPALLGSPFVHEGFDQAMHFAIVFGRHHVQMEVRCMKKRTR